MVASEFVIENAPHSPLRYIYGSPFQSLLAIVTVVCVFTRLLTGMQNVISHTHAERPVKRASTIPYWVPFVGSAVFFAMDIQGTIVKGWWVPKTPTRHRFFFLRSRSSLISYISNPFLFYIG